MKRNRRDGRGKHRVHITDDDTTYEYDPIKLMHGIGSGRIRSGPEGRAAERVAAALLINVWREGSTGALFVGMTVDELIASARELVRAGRITENGMGSLPAEFN